MNKGTKNTVKLWVIILVILALPCTPLVMYLTWQFSALKPFNVLILDKTVLTDKVQEHVSLSWVLTYNRYVKRNDGKLYDKTKDYFGFFPLDDEKYAIKDFGHRSDVALDSIAKIYDMLYTTDTYGIYSNEWYQDQNVNERSTKLYGGLTNNELKIMQRLRAQKKLVISEFNTFASPTTAEVRLAFTKSFGVRWSGWVGKHFLSFDTAKAELPKWLVNNYRLKHKDSWPFKKGGIALVNLYDDVVILEDTKELKEEVPHIYTKPEFARKYGIPEVQKYPFWFDVVWVEQNNETPATYKISTTLAGDALLAQWQLPSSFAAIVKSPDNHFFYFVGDFSDNNISDTYAYFKGIGIFKKAIYNNTTVDKREDFFWEYYRPLVSGIINNYYTERTGKK